MLSSLCEGFGKVAANGPAIWGGCVTWRSHPATCPGALAEKLSRWQDTMAQFLPVPAKNKVVSGAGFVQSRKRAGRKLRS
jgi:hypothetical protein